MPDTQAPVQTGGLVSPPEALVPSPDKRVVALARLAADTRTGKEPRPTSSAEVAQFTAELVRPVQQWCLAHADKVSVCYIATHEGMPAVYVGSRAGRYDFSLGQPLADLEGDLADRGWRCFILQLSSDTPSARQAFFDETKALRLVPGTSEVAGRASR